VSIFDEPSPRAPDHTTPLGDILEPPDLQPTGLTVQTHRDASSTGELASIAQSLGPRDLVGLERSFTEIGRRLGGQLNSQGGSLAFYDWVQKGGRIEGASIVLMNALANEWGRIICQVHVLDYDPRTRRAMLRARVLDLLTIRAEEVDHPCTIAPTPGKFADDPAQAQRWVTMQLRGQGSRAKRNAIEQVIPGHLTAIAMRAAKAAHAKLVLGDHPFEKVRDQALQVLGNMDRRLTLQVLEAWLRVHHTEWTLDELGALKVLRDDLKSRRAKVVQVLEEARDNGPPSRGDDTPPAAAPDQGDDGTDDLGVARPSGEQREARIAHLMNGPAKLNRDQAEAVVDGTGDMGNTDDYIAQQNANLGDQLLELIRELGDEAWTEVRVELGLDPAREPNATTPLAVRAKLRDAMVARRDARQAQPEPKDERPELLMRITSLESQLAQYDKALPGKVRRDCGVKQVQHNSPVKRFRTLIEALEAELAAQQQRTSGEQRDEEDDGPPVVDPSMLDAIGDRPRFLENIHTMEHALGEGPVTTTREDCAEAWEFEAFPPLSQLKARRLTDYARRLFDLGWM
jgi:hypothetical protein